MPAGDWDIINKARTGPVGAQGPIGVPGTPGWIDSSLVEYVDALFNIMGIDMTYLEFKSMTESERKQFVRNIKLNKIIENGDE